MPKSCIRVFGHYGTEIPGGFGCVSVLPPETSEGYHNRLRTKALRLNLGGARFAGPTQGFTLLGDAAARETQLRDSHGFCTDPAYYPRPLYNVVGEAYLQHGIPMLAINAFENVLKYVKNDAFALAGLVQAHHAQGDLVKAAEYYGRLLYVWSDADPDLRWMIAARKLGLAAQPTDESPATQRNYKSQTLARLRVR